MRKQILVMCGIAVLLGLGARVVQKQPVPFWGYPTYELLKPRAALAESNAASVDSTFPAADKAYDIDLALTQTLFAKRKTDNIPFIDARDPKLYTEGHIAGAINIPFEKLSEFHDKLDQFPKSQFIVLYCDGGDCHLSHDLAEQMNSEGWKRLAVYTGGWAEWSKEVLGKGE